MAERAIETAKSVIRGIYPSQLRNGFKTVPIFTLSYPAENMWPRSACAKYFILFFLLLLHKRLTEMRKQIRKSPEYLRILNQYSPLW